MNLYLKFINFIYYVVIVALISFIGWSVFDTGKRVYNDFANQEAQLMELYENQGYLLARIYELASRPNYEYLSSVATYMMNDNKVGTGVIIAYKRGYHYILTNKHVCNKYNVSNCKVVTSQGIMDVEYVKQSESSDMSIWRTKNLSKGSKVVKGFRQTFRGDTVFSVGNYLGFPLIYTEGTFAGYDNGLPLYNLPCAFGCSGSGVFDNQGNLTGLISGVPAFKLPNYGIVQVDTNKIVGIHFDNMILFLDEIIN